jgi:uncharacterized protein YndB with AHSA1/START domain
MKIDESVEIGCGMEEVWQFVSDPANDTAWCPKVQGIDRVAADRWRVTHRPVPLRPVAVLDVQQLAVEPPHRLLLREEDPASVFEVEYLLESIGIGRTRFTQTSEFQWKKLPSVFHVIFDYGVRRDVRKQLRELKLALEAR